MISIDLNCDMGEGMPDDAALMPFISSANIACGYHAGDTDTMNRTVEIALQHKVAIGAHPGFDDKENFGRKEQCLIDNSYYDLVMDQLYRLKAVTDGFGVKLHHVKPHGALYNMAAKDKHLASIIAKAVHDFDDSLLLYGLSGSFSISEAKAVHLKTASEVFADRKYTDDGSLTPRTLPNALIKDALQSIQQVLQMITQQSVYAVSNKLVPVAAETICIHSDGPHSVEFAKKINEALKENNIEIKAV